MSDILEELRGLAEAAKTKKNEHTRKSVFNKRRKNKQRAIEYMGNKCCDCGGTFPACVYDFHHIDPTTKDRFTPSHLMQRDWEYIVLELAKCVMICANCHRIRHYREHVMSEEEKDCG